jgi:hypothetical protein
MRSLPSSWSAVDVEVLGRGGPVASWPLCLNDPLTAEPSTNKQAIEQLLAVGAWATYRSMSRIQILAADQVR